MDSNFSEQTPYSEILSEIQRLKSLADKAREKDLEQVISNVKSLISTYGLTAVDLGFDLLPESKDRVKKGTVAPKYRNEQGQQWSGRGKRPLWLSKSLEAGAKIDDFLINSDGKS